MGAIHNEIKHLIWSINSTFYNEYLTSMAFQDGLQVRNKTNKENIFLLSKQDSSIYPFMYVQCIHYIKNMLLFLWGKQQCHGVMTQRLPHHSFWGFCQCSFCLDPLILSLHATCVNTFLNRNSFQMRAEERKAWILFWHGSTVKNSTAFAFRSFVLKHHNPQTLKSWNFYSVLANRFSSFTRWGHTWCN